MVITYSKDTLDLRTFCSGQISNNPAGNYVFKVNNRNIRATCEICSKLIKLTINNLLLTKLTINYC